MKTFSGANGLLGLNAAQPAEQELHAGTGTAVPLMPAYPIPYVDPIHTKKKQLATGPIAVIQNTDTFNRVDTLHAHKLAMRSKVTPS